MIRDLNESEPFKVIRRERLGADAELRAKRFQPACLTGPRHQHLTNLGRN
jgi:hypothetical protein